MLENPHPVDRLAEIREQIRRLKADEKTVREALLEDGAETDGKRFRAEIRSQSRRVFLKERLPSEILQDESYWEVRESLIVRVKPIETSGGPDIELIDSDDHF
jgi:hypothetical protein